MYAPNSNCLGYAIVFSAVFICVLVAVGIGVEHYSDKADIVESKQRINPTIKVTPKGDTVYIYKFKK